MATRERFCAVCCYPLHVKVLFHYWHCVCVRAVLWYDILYNNVWGQLLATCHGIPSISSSHHPSLSFPFLHDRPFHFPFFFSTGRMHILSFFYLIKCLEKVLYIFCNKRRSWYFVRLCEFDRLHNFMVDYHNKWYRILFLIIVRGIHLNLSFYCFINFLLYWRHSDCEWQN